MSRFALMRYVSWLNLKKQNYNEGQKQLRYLKKRGFDTTISFRPHQLYLKSAYTPSPNQFCTGTKPIVRAIRNPTSVGGRGVVFLCEAVIIE